MPELPEVEINRRNLQRWTSGRRVTALRTPDSVRFVGATADVVGRRFVVWRRRGKLLQGDLEGGATFQSHLGMTGQWLADPSPERRGVRVLLEFADGDGPRYVGLADPRRFGQTTIFAPGDPAGSAAFDRLGPDALLSPMSPPALADALGRRATPLKSRLLDQAVIAGLGNIAVIEVAYRARLHPHLPVSSLRAADLGRLLEAIAAHIEHVLDVETGDEIAYLGSAGAHNPFLCYGRESGPCPRCATPFVRGALGGRPSFWCPNCQPAPG
ncbi:MAG: DNA-formamidopyrimidine glycosylase family protein [Myxococcota bacterium]